MHELRRKALHRLLTAKPKMGSGCTLVTEPAAKATYSCSLRSANHLQARCGCIIVQHNLPDPSSMASEVAWQHLCPVT